MGEAWFAASSHFHLEQMCVKSLDGVPVDLDNSVYLLSFKESHRRTVMKSGAIVPFKAMEKKKKCAGKDVVWAWTVLILRHNKQFVTSICGNSDLSFAF